MTSQDGPEILFPKTGSKALLQLYPNVPFLPVKKQMREDKVFVWVKDGMSKEVHTSFLEIKMMGYIWPFSRTLPPSSHNGFIHPVPLCFHHGLAGFFPEAGGILG